MVIKTLSDKIKDYYVKGLKDEYFVMGAVQNTLGGECYKATEKEDKFHHIDFWWDSPKGRKVAIDAKGIKKDKQSDKKYNDKIHWIEMKNVNGNPGWIYGKADYIAFRTFKNIIFVKRTKLVTYAEEKTKGFDICIGNRPEAFYMPYRRKDRLDIIFKCPIEDLIEMSDFIIDCSELKEC